MDCSKKGLAVIPNITNYLTEKAWFMDFSNNNLYSLSDGIFSNLTLGGLFLNNNNLTYIGDNVFQGSANILSNLKLDNNKLREIPRAIGKLSNLYTLTVQENFIPEFNIQVLRNISKSLAKISYGSATVTKWPKEMAVLDRATQLNIYGLNVSIVPEDAFLDELFTLSVTSTRVTSFSRTFDNKPMLYQLFLENNTILSADGITSGGFTNVPQLQTISIKNSPLDSLPLIFNNITQYADVTFAGCPIKYIKNSTFQGNGSKIYYLSLDSTMLEEVPRALSRLTSIITLFVTNGKIGEIKGDDFTGMTSLFNLHLTGNPILNVSLSAFRDLNKLKFLSLANTKLTSIPKAIQNTPLLQTVDFSGSRVECSCSSLGWMKTWFPQVKNRTKIMGTCFNTKRNIQDYVIFDIPKCK